MRFLTIVAFAILICSPVMANEGDALPIKRGIYMPDGTECIHAMENGNTSGVSLIFVGRKMHMAGGYAGACDMKKKSISGNVHAITELCGTEDDSDPRVKVEQKYVVKSETQFSVSGETYNSKGELIRVTENYRWCAPAPADF